MATIKELNTQTFDIAINKAAQPILVDFYAPWCGPCNAFAPTLREVGIENADDLTVVKVNIDDSPELATKYGIQSIPTLLLFQGGAPVAQIQGLVSKEELVKQLQPFLAHAQCATN